MSAPNILLVMTDQQRYDSLACYGFEHGHTPNLDKLAADGVIFDRCYTPNPLCTPARASLMTGHHLPGHGVYKLYDCLDENQVMFTERLQERGYQTALFGKLHVSSRFTEAEQRHPHDGFDIYEWCLEASISLDSPFNGYGQWLKAKDPAFFERLARDGRKVLHVPREVHMTHWAAERTIDFIQNWGGDQPFFCKMSVFDPHDPYEDFPLEFGELVNADSIPAPLRPTADAEPVPSAHERERHGGYMDDFAGYSADDLRTLRHGYHASIALIDLEVGRVLDALAERGIVDDTLVIFVSDHGDMLGDHDLLIKGPYFFDPCVRVPLIMRWPARFDAGRRVQGLVQLHDLTATILDAAGVHADDLADWMPDSRSLLPLARGEAESVRDHAVTLYRNSGRSLGSYWDPPIHASMFRDERYKLVVYHNEVAGELYDMQADPDEMHNLWTYPAHEAVKTALTTRLMDWLVAREVGQLGSRGGEQLAPS